MVRNGRDLHSRKVKSSQGEIKVQIQQGLGRKLATTASEI